MVKPGPNSQGTQYLSFCLLILLAYKFHNGSNVVFKPFDWKPKVLTKMEKIIQTPGNGAFN